MGSTIDANCWKDYVDEKITDNSGIGTAVFSVAQSTGGVLMDAGGICKQQYISMKRPYAEQLFDAWAEEATLSGQLKLVDVSGKENYFKVLGRLGIPKAEHIFFRVAVHGVAKYLVSKDSDFFDPAMKKAGEDEKLALLESGKGPVCVYMKKSHHVKVCSPETYINLSVDIGA
jgi:hypothetical protein